jgi:hypothetical protein
VANPTTNYGFVLPTPTDLVTDLPADFDVALQGVDTRLKALQPGTTLGDIAYSSATANTNTRLGIGTSGQVLAVSGGGVPAWTTISSGSMTLLASTALSGASVSFTSISGAYKNLQLVITDWEVNGGTLRFTINNDASALYDRVGQQLNNSGTASIVSSSDAANVNLSGDTPSTGAALNHTVIDFFDYTASTAVKLGRFLNVYDMSTAAYGIVNAAWAYSSATALTRIDLSLSTSTFAAGNAYLYGVN